MHFSIPSLKLLRESLIDAFFNDYVSTFIVSLFSMISVIGINSLFARILEKNDFLLFNLITRYFGLFHALLCGMLGYGVIKIVKEKTTTKHEIIQNIVSYYLTAFTLFLCLIIIAFYRSELVFNSFKLGAFILASLWLLAQSFKHFISSLFRGFDLFTKANTYTLVVEVFAICLGLLCVWWFSLSFYIYLFIVGILSLSVSAYMIFIVEDFTIKRANFDLGVLKKIVKFSVSRCLENLFRLLLIITVITFLAYKDKIEIAGYIALLYSLIKVGESSLQTLTTVIFTKATKLKKNQIKQQIHIQLIIAFFISIAVFFIFYFFGNIIIKVWLGNDYLFLAPQFAIVSLTYFPIVSISLTKGVFENLFVHSPLVLLNLGLNLSVIVLFFINITLASIVWFFVIVLWIRLMFYMLIFYFRYASFPENNKY